MAKQTGKWDSSIYIQFHLTWTFHLYSFIDQTLNPEFQIGKRRTYAMEETVVRSIRVLSILLQGEYSNAVYNINA